MKEEIRQRFDAYKDEMLRDLAALVAVNSMRGETTPDCPFGTEPARALALTLEMGKRMGFAVDNVDNYAGSIFYGEGKEDVAVMAHLDIVPAGKGWKTDPFVLTEKDGRLYGRGVSDDKGPVIGALYGLRVLRDMGLPLKRRLNLIVGTDEEQGSGCMKYYREHRPVPEIGFTPDAEYPVIYAEKGSIWAWVSAPLEKTPILSIQGGMAFNAVPAECTAKLDGAVVSLEALKASLRTDDAEGFEPSVEKDADGNILLTIKGRAAHASTPELGVNAVISMVNLLCHFLGEKSGKMLLFIRDTIGRDTTGKRAGLYMEDAESGATTLNLGLIDYGPERQRFSLDIRFPVSGTKDALDQSLARMCKKYGLSYVLVNGDDPHYVPKDSELISTLIRVYREATGDQQAEPLAIGGGTYARKLGKNFAGFGPNFPNKPSVHEHDADEFCVIEDYLRHCVICAMAMYELAK